MNMVMIYDYADRLNSAKKIEECRNIAATAFAGCSDDDIKEIGGVSEYYDTAVTIFVMAINRSLSFAMDIDKTSLDFYDLVDANAAEAEKVFRDLVNGLEDCALEDYSVFREYLNKIAEYIFRSYNTHDWKNNKSQRSQYDREKALREYMMNFIRPNKVTNLNEFNKKYGIQIPYMYATIFEISNIISSSQHGSHYTDSEERNPEEDNQYAHTKVRWFKKYLRTFKNRELLNIMNISEYCSDVADPTWRPSIRNIDEMIYIDCVAPKINFEKLLPHMEYSDEIYNESYFAIYAAFLDYRDKRGNISPLWYRSIPLIPSIDCEKVDMKKYAAYVVTAFAHDNELEDKNKELEETNQALKKEQEEKEQIVHEFRHTYGNMTSYGLQAIADKLLSNHDKEIKVLGRQAMMELSIKKDLSSAIEMLVWKIDGDCQKLREQIREGISTAPRDGYQTIYEVADEAMKRIMLRVFYDRSDDEKLWEGQDNFCGLLGVEDLEKAMDDFEENVLSGGVLSLEKWLRSKGLDLEFTIDGGFENLFFKSNSHGAFFLKDIISECFFNMVKYSDFTKPLSIKFTSEGNRYIISFENTPSENSKYFRSGKGLSSKKEIIGMLNEEGMKPVSGLDWRMRDGRLVTETFFEKDFLEGRV